MNDGTLVHVLHSHFDHHANRMAISYDDGDGPLKLTYGQLGHRVESVAWQLASYGSKDDVACLVYDHGIDFVIGFLACLFTGIVAAPSSPPRASRNRDTNQRLERFVSICRQADPRLVLTTRELRPQIERGLQDTADPQIVCTDRVSEANSTHLQPDVRPDDIALLQYTSGSTGTPNGVMISHANLVANQQAIQRATGSSSSTVSVSWLPLFHDMGLVSGLLHPLYLGGLAVLMSPQQFTSNPMRWLEAISKYRATFTGGPNFAYELLADQVTYAERNSLDLSSLRVLYNGAEPIDAATMRRFVERFRACGLREGAIFPCYGLAESTLIVSGGPIDKSPTVRSVDRHSLELGMIQNAAEHADSVDLVSCGLPTDSKIIIADRSTQAALNRNEVGEIWVQSDSVGAGYYLDDDATAETFLNTLDGYDGTFLRTGDLGFIDERGELFVTGRCKDIIVVCGRNIYPQDVERCVSQVLSLSPRYRCVAVGLKRFGTEQIGLLVECNSELRKLARQSDKTEIEKLAAETRSEVNRVFDASVGIIAFTRTGSVPRTSSGKVRRQMCVELIEHSDCSIYRSTTLFEQKSPIQKSSQAAQLQLLLSTVLTPSQLKIIESVGESVTLEQLGVDSLTRASVASDIEKRLNITIEPAELSSKSDLGMLAKLISRAQKRRDAAPINTRNRHGVAKRQTRPSERDELPSSNGGRVYKLHAPQSIDSKETSLTDFVQRESRDIFEKTADFRGWYDDAAQRGYKRYLLPVLKHQGGRAIVGADEYSSQREVILFGSADYLGLAHSRRVKNAATESIAAHGCNVASVPLVAGSTPIHQQLEQAICDLLSHEACVLFPTGHSANMATIAALCSQQDTVIVDNRVHYSILEGARLAHCHWRTFVHNDPDSLKQVLECVRKQGADRGALVVLEGVYGIDGDLPLLDELVAVARAFDARVMLDDAHGIGVLGPRGEGTAAHLKANTRPDIVMGSLSKSIGSFGGFIATSRNVADYLRFYAKAISFAVGLPAANAAAGLEGLQIIGGQPERLESLRRKADFLRAALLDEGLRNVQRSESTIMSARIGDESLLRDITRELFDAGVWAEGLPFPAVARGQERLRFRVREVHDFDDLEEAATITGRVCRKYLEPSSSAGCRFDLQPEFQWVRATELAPSEARQLCHLAIRQAKREDCPLSWISPEFISKYFCRSSYWQDLPSTFEWRLGYMNGEIAAAFCVDRANVYLNGWPVRGVLIGSLMFDEGHDERLMAQLEQAVTEASVDCDVVSFPACHPVPIFGAGVESWKANGGQATDKPLFEASLPKRLLNALSFEGCSVGAHKGYAYVELSEMSPTEPTPLSGTLKIRDFDRTDFRNETTDFIHPIFCETIAKLDMCSEVPASTLTGLVQDLRELAVPGLWLMAECLGEPAGFALCYPNISAEFQRVAGNADVADYHRIQEKMESAREAFLAWIAVRPEFSGEGVSAALVEQLRSRLLARHYTHIWLSWEFVDGDISMEQHCERFGDVVRVVEMPCYVTRNSTASSQPSTRHAKMSS